MVDFSLYDKKKITIMAIVLFVFIGIIIFVSLVIKNNIIKNGENAVILNDYTNFTKSKRVENVKLLKELNEGDTVKLIKIYTDKNNVEWAKIGYKNKIRICEI